ncbi:MAG: GNAT family N-acetyltransferase [Tissierellia bacterium]|nr:GNAT family N-acetyltransferase [Tissierellia bacterium]
MNIKKIKFVEIKEINNSLINLCLKSSDYFILSGGKSPDLTDINELLKDIPPDKKYEDKFFSGIYLEEKMIALVDIIKDYPSEGKWMIGLLLIDPDYRNRGFGSLIHEMILKKARENIISEIYIAVVIKNTKAMNFWKNLGYRDVKKTTAKLNQIEQEIQIMSISLI